MGGAVRRGSGRRAGQDGGARTFLRAGLAVCAAVALVGGCRTGDDAGPATGSGAPAEGGHAVSPLRNPDGTKPGLAPVTSKADQAAAWNLIGELTTKGRGPKTGYDRDRFGYAWMDTADGVPFARNGCDTRIISMIRAVMELFSQRTRGVVGCA
jgi:hypothetical protein